MPSSISSLYENDTTGYIGRTFSSKVNDTISLDLGNNFETTTSTFLSLDLPEGSYMVTAVAQCYPLITWYGTLYLKLTDESGSTSYYDSIFPSNYQVLNNDPDDANGEYYYRTTTGVFTLTESGSINAQLVCRAYYETQDDSQDVYVQLYDGTSLTAVKIA
jgi:hypothetical protein